MTTKSSGVTPLVVQKLLIDSLNSKINREKIDNTRLHFVPISLDTFIATLKHVVYDSNIDDYGVEIDFEKLTKDAIAYITNRHKFKLVATGNGFSTMEGLELSTDTIKTHLPAVIYATDRTTVIGGLYSGFNKAYDGLFRDFFNKEISQYLSSARYDRVHKAIADKAIAEGRKVGKGYSVGFDVGHIFLQDNTLGDTPLKLAIQKLQENLDRTINSKISSSQKSQLVDIRKKVDQAMETLATRSTYGAKVFTTLDKSITDSLATVSAVIVIAQDRIENQYEYGTLIEGAISNDLIRLLKEVQFSPNIIEEIDARVLGPLTGKKSSGAVKATQKLKPESLKGKKPKVSLTTSNLAPTNIKIKKVTDSEVPTVSLTNLQALINMHLQHVIAANMGSGGQRNILNYRTGRLAASATVERLTQSRDGMITAFYSYMKNPYATFSEGGRQQFPRSRDPKLLISKSIREIAATKVGNRLRAVVI